MSKLIIKNKTEISDIEVLKYVSKVIELGRISNNEKQYCYMSVLEKEGVEYHIVTDLRKFSDVFTFYKSSHK